jgi:hypothetical protein
MCLRLPQNNSMQGEDELNRKIAHGIGENKLRVSQMLEQPAHPEFQTSPS